MFGNKELKNKAFTTTAVIMKTANYFIAAN